MFFWPNKKIYKLRLKVRKKQFRVKKLNLFRAVVIKSKNKTSKLIQPNQHIGILPKELAMSPPDAIQSDLSLRKMMTRAFYVM